MFKRRNRYTARVRSLPAATRRVHASRLAWLTMTIRLRSDKAAA